MTNEEFLRSVSLEGEEWRDVVGYEGYYMVSSYGRVISLHNTKRYNLRLKKTYLNQNGYIYVMLCKNKRKLFFGIHRLIAKAFIPNPNNYTQIDHINGIRTDNRIENLKWSTYTMNNNNPITKIRQAIGNRTDKSKSAEIVCIKDGSVFNIYPYIKYAENDGFCPSCISLCLKGKQPHHKGYKWMYLSDYENLKSESQRTP